MLARVFVSVLCLVPICSVLLSFAVLDRAEGLGLLLLGAVLFVCSALVASSNFYHLWLRFNLKMRRTGNRDGLPSVSGVPLLGNLCALAVWLLPASVLTSALALFFLAIDLCGTLWFLPSMWARSAQAPESPLSDTGKATLLLPSGPMQQFDVVRIVRLDTPSRHYDGTQGISRAPRVGDVGSVVELWTSGGPNDLMIVEATDEEGRTLWLADFSGSELELLSKAPRD